jgi:hypothetical protein
MFVHPSLNLLVNHCKLFVYMLQRPKYNNMEPDPIEFFGECMNSPHNGRTPLAEELYVSSKLLHKWNVLKFKYG